MVQPALMSALMKAVVSGCQSNMCPGVIMCKRVDG
jgi:hypothetical protein